MKEPNTNRRCTTVATPTILNSAHPWNLLYYTWQLFKTPDRQLAFLKCLFVNRSAGLHTKFVNLRDSFREFLEARNTRQNGMAEEKEFDITSEVCTCHKV